MKTWTALFLVDCLYSVDIFFWIGGFFLGFVMADTKKVKAMNRPGVYGPLSLVMAVVHRVLRIWPCYIMTMLFLKYVIAHIGSGPR
jgi:peptidoglycan/LPS O-acetylase OafA/YrhL